MESNNKIQSTIHQQILEQIVDDLLMGMRRDKIIRKYKDKLQRGEESIKRLIREAVESISIQDEDTKNEIKMLNIARLNDLYSKCYNDKNWKDARATVDILNKTADVYNPTLNVNQNDTLKFEFENDQATNQNINNENENV